MTSLRWSIRSQPLLSFLAVAYGLTWLLMLPVVATSRGWVELDWPHWWEGVAAFGPLVAAWWILRHDPNKSGLLEWRASFRRFDWGSRGTFLVVGSPFVCLGLALAINAGFAPESAKLVESRSDVLISTRALLELLLLSSLIQSIGEEPGWRGYALPQLYARFGRVAATLMLFPLWLLWHLPIFLSREGLGVTQFAAFATGIFSATIFLTVIYEHTRSIAAAIVWHALINATRGLALGVSVFTFLVFGAAVAIGALLLACFVLKTDNVVK